MHTICIFGCLANCKETQITHVRGHFQQTHSVLLSSLLSTDSPSSFSKSENAGVLQGALSTLKLLIITSGKILRRCGRDIIFRLFHTLLFSLVVDFGALEGYSNKRLHPHHCASHCDERDLI